MCPTVQEKWLSGTQSPTRNSSSPPTVKFGSLPSTVINPQAFGGSGSGGNTNNNYGQADSSMLTANLDIFDYPVGDMTTEMKKSSWIVQN